MAFDEVVGEEMKGVFVVLHEPSRRRSRYPAWLDILVESGASSSPHLANCLQTRAREPVRMPELSG